MQHNRLIIPELKDAPPKTPGKASMDGSHTHHRQYTGTSAIPFPSLSTSSASSPAAADGGSKVIPRPPNAWILYRSHKLEQLKQEESQRDRGEDDPHSASSSSPPRGALTAGVLSWLAAANGSDSSAAGGDSTTRRSASPVAATPSTTANTPAATTAAHSPATPGANASTAASNSTPISSLIAQLWRSESDEVKQTFYELAKEKQEEHKRLWPQYKYQPRITEKSKLARERRRTNSGGNGPHSPTSSVPSPNDVFQVPTHPPPKSRNGSMKRARKSSGLEWASSPYSEAAASPYSYSSPATPCRKRRTPDVGSPASSPMVASPTPRGRRLRGGRTRGRQSSRGFSPRLASCSSSSSARDVTDNKLQLIFTASPADLTLSPNPSTDTNTLSPSSWAFRDAQRLSSFQSTPTLAPMPPAVPPSARTSRFSDDPPVTNPVNVYEFFDKDTSSRNLPIQPGTELFELDPALAEHLDLRELWKESLGQDAELFDWSAGTVQDPVVPELPEQQDEWMKTIDWDNLAAAERCEPITAPTPVDTAMMQDLTQYILSQATDAGTATETGGEKRAESTSSLSARSKSPSKREGQMNASPSRSRTRRIRGHKASPSPPPLRLSPPPPLPRGGTSQHEQSNSPFSDDCARPTSTSPHQRTLRTSPRRRPRPLLPSSSVHSSPIRGPPSPSLSPTPSSEEHRVLRSSRGRPKVGAVGPERRGNGLEDGQDFRRAHCALDSIPQPAPQLQCASPSPTTTTGETKSSSSATPATTTGATTSFELHGSYTEDELLDMLARRRLQRRGGV